MLFIADYTMSKRQLSVLRSLQPGAVPRVMESGPGRLACSLVVFLVSNPAKPMWRNKMVE